MEKIKVLIKEEEIEKRVEEMAKEIERDYKGKEIVLLGVLKGSVIFLAELAKRIKNELTMEFVDISSYEGTESTGKITLHKDITSSIEGKNVIIVEDIVDTGRTLSYLIELLKSKKPNSIRIATILSKPSRRIINLDVDYVGFEIEDKFVIGYGLDYNQKYRNLPYIGYIEKGM